MEAERIRGSNKGTKKEKYKNKGRKEESTSKGVQCDTSHNHGGRLFQPMCLVCCPPHRTPIGSDVVEKKKKRGSRKRKDE